MTLSLLRSVSLSLGAIFALGAIIATLVSILVLKFKTRTQSDTTANTATSTTDTTSTNTKTLYIGNLPYKASEMDIRKLFETYGQVVSIRLMKDRYTGKRRGFGFVVMDNNGGQLAIEKLNGSEFGQRNLKVKEANEQKPKSQTKTADDEH